MVEIGKKQPVNLLIARFPGGYSEIPDIGDWLARNGPKWTSDPRIRQWGILDSCGTPITMLRNQAIKYAQDNKYDLVLMMDSDNVPDIEVLPFLKAFNAASPFWDTSFNFWWEHDGPCIIAAPYCGNPPEELVHIFYWKKHTKDDYSLAKYSREVAAHKKGIQREAALPTGLILIDMKAVEKIKPPYFYYEWRDFTETEKATTEDVAFTRDISFAGVPLYCNWDSWAGHYKSVIVGKPREVNLNTVARKWKSTILQQSQNGEKMPHVEFEQRVREVNSYPELPPGMDAEATWGDDGDSTNHAPGIQELRQPIGDGP